jgi:hypothetical protein
MFVCVCVFYLENIIKYDRISCIFCQNATKESEMETIWILDDRYRPKLIENLF